MRYVKEQLNLITILSLILSLLLTSCGSGTTPFKEVFRKQTPYEKYEQSLQNANLSQTALGQEWISAGQKALRDSLVITIPFRETGYFAADKPVAYSYRLQARRGERIVVRVDVQSRQPVRVFVDIFEMGGVPKALASADTVSNSLDYEVEQEQEHLIRIQPELLRGGRYTISVTSAPTLGFPVAGKDDRAIGSFWGMPRDGGSRKHEGVDIFAKRGTPAVAATEGIVQRVNTNRLGGKVVWLADKKRNQVLYYAHLDSQLVQPGQRVVPGDTVGLVGNTGNAATTQPHLHFGIYRYMGGAVDPYPSLRRPSGEPARVAVGLDGVGNWHRVSIKKADLKAAPHNSAVTLLELKRNTPFILLAGTGNWYRIALPTGETGYLSQNALETIEKPVKQIKLLAAYPVLDFPDPAAAVMEETPAKGTIRGLAKFSGYWLVETSKGRLGWLPEREPDTRAGS